MAVYAIWNNKGGVGKSYLTFQIASEFARTHADVPVVVVDICPQANSSAMLLGGMVRGEEELDRLWGVPARPTIAGYVRTRIQSPYDNPRTGSNGLLTPNSLNPNIPANLYLVPGDEELELLSSRVSNACRPGPDDAWAKVHRWVTDLIEDLKVYLNTWNLTVFLDCNPSFTVYTELALSSADHLIVPFTADGSSKRAVSTVIRLLYGNGASLQSDYFLYTQQFRLSKPRIYCYVGNRMTQFLGSARAYRAVVEAIGKEIYGVWQTKPAVFSIHPDGSHTPRNRTEFDRMFRFEIPDANTASVVSSALGIPIVSLRAGQYVVNSKAVLVNQSQLDRQQPQMVQMVKLIE
ncbi:MAG: ParA family protein [Candidatus Eremiobacterota bacterium]